MNKKTAGIIAAAIAAAAVTTAGIYNKAAYAVFRNLTARKLDLDENAAWSGGRVYERVPYAGDSDSQYLDLYIPDGGAETNSAKPRLFVLVHGGGFISNDSQSRQAILMYQYFRDHGYACASVNYRLAQEAPFPAGLEDVKAAVRFLQSHAEDYGYDASRTAIWGESAGGYLAMAEAFSNEKEFMGVRYLGQDEDEAAGKFYTGEAAVLIDYYGAADLGATFGGDDWKELEIPQTVINVANSWIDKKALEGYSSVEAYWLRREFDGMTEEDRKAFDPHYFLDENLGPEKGPAVMIVHGDCDITVPYLQSQRLYEHLVRVIGEERTLFLLCRGEGHATDMLYSGDMLAKVDAFIRRH
ncbi:MAG: alpha/beta hydrolase [Lachnospiraceae bacterium]|nr:alpha/beta hydrolase [Lachnospiraceae bacterium]